MHSEIICEFFRCGCCPIITPQAKQNDDLLELTVLKKPPFYASQEILMRLRHGDREPVFFEEEIHLKVRPKSLKVIYPRQRLTNNEHRPKKLDVD